DAAGNRRDRSRVVRVRGQPTNGGWAAEDRSSLGPPSGGVTWGPPNQRLVRHHDSSVLHVNLTHENRSLIRAEQIRRMERRALPNNTARGPVVENKALVEALNAGHLGGAGIDVFDNEPIPAGHPLLACHQWC